MFGEHFYCDEGEGQEDQEEGIETLFFLVVFGFGTVAVDEFLVAGDVFIFLLSCLLVDARKVLFLILRLVRHLVIKVIITINGDFNISNKD